MKCICSSLTQVVLCFVFAALCTTAHAVMQPTELFIGKVFGTASYSVDGKWQPLADGMKLAAGAVVKTGANSTVDLLLPASATALRLIADSELRLDRLNKESAGETTISETSITLLSGALAGAQIKLNSQSRFQINTPDGEIQIVGTKYLVRSDGAVSVIEGEVSIRYNLPGNKGSVELTVKQGFSFDPVTGKVVTTTSDFLQNTIKDIDTTAENAETFRVGGGATLVVKPKEAVSPP